MLVKEYFNTLTNMMTGDVDKAYYINECKKLLTKEQMIDLLFKIPSEYMDIRELLLEVLYPQEMSA